MPKALLSSLLAAVLLTTATPSFAASFSKADFLTVMLNYKYSEDYKVVSASSKCGDTKNTVSEDNWYLDVDDLNIKGKTEETYLYFNGMTYLLTGKIKHNAEKGIYKVDLEGGFAAEQATGTADVVVTGSLDESDPYVIKKLNIKVTEHRTADFTDRTCKEKAVVKSIDAYTFLTD